MCALPVNIEGQGIQYFIPVVLTDGKSMEGLSISPTKSAAAAAAKSPQSCPTLCDPIDGSPPGSPIPGILQARILEWVAISFSRVAPNHCSNQKCTHSFPENYYHFC